MASFLTRNSLYLVRPWLCSLPCTRVVRWASLPVLQCMLGLFFVGIVAHVWEENCFPGGFAEMIASKLKFSAKSKRFGEAITMVAVVSVAVGPLFFACVMFLVLAPMLLGVMEAVGHTAMIRLFDLKRPYSPGLVTAVFILLPISAYSLSYAVGHHLVSPLDWVGAFLYMAASVLLAQWIVVTASGVKYSQFLRNARAALFTR